MLKTRRYVYTIFMCHLALEKILKAKVYEITDKTPPKTHNLRYLSKLSKLEVSQDILEFLSKLSDVSIPTRYPEDFSKLIESYNEEVATERYLTTRKLLLCLPNFKVLRIYMLQSTRDSCIFPP